MQRAEDPSEEKVIRETKLRPTDAHLCSFKTFLNYNFSTNHHLLSKIHFSLHTFLHIYYI